MQLTLNLTAEALQDPAIKAFLAAATEREQAASEDLRAGTQAHLAQIEKWKRDDERASKVTQP